MAKIVTQRRDLIEGKEYIIISLNPHDAYIRTGRIILWEILLRRFSVLYDTDSHWIYLVDCVTGKRWVFMDGFEALEIE